MSITTLPLHRRTRVERRVLSILRGEERFQIADGEQDPFLTLRALAPAHNLSIRPSSMPYVSQSELTLLALIAAAQRLEGLAATRLNPEMETAINKCAASLSVNRLHLSPLTLYSGERN